MLSSITIRQKLWGFCLLSLTFSMAIAVAGYWGQLQMRNAMTDLMVQVAAQKNFMQADMEHDALHTDAIAAMLAGKMPVAELEAETKKIVSDLREHASLFRDSLVEVKKLELDDAIKNNLAKSDDALNAYVRSAEVIVSVALKDPVAAQAQFAEFEKTFKSLEFSMAEITNLIDRSAKRSEANSGLSSSYAQSAIVLGLLMCGLVLFSICFVFTRSITQPLAGAVRVAESIAAGDLTQKIDVRSQDETGQLMQAMNKMKVVLSRDFTERKRAQEEILRLNVSLEERVRLRTVQLQSANKELEAFSYSVSHDLRTPLRSIAGFSSLLARELGASTASERTKHYLARIRAGVVQMGELIDALLALAQVSGTRLCCDSVDLSAMAQTVLDGYCEREPGRQAQVDVQPSLVVQGDPHLLLQALDNLLGNAWKFSSLRPQARIAFRRETGPDGEAVYVVQDNGAGFDMVYSEKLFGAFQRLHSVTEFAGTGIGLATVHKIITRHGGKIWAKSAPDEGASFHFTLGNLDSIQSELPLAKADGLVLQTESLDA
jgi:signal transduction histidine kinase